MPYHEPSLPVSVPKLASPPGALSRLAIWGRISLVYGCLEGALWSRPSLRDPWSLTAAGLIAGSLVFDLLQGALRGGDLGIGLRGLREGWWIPVAGMVLAGAILLTAWKAGSLHSLFGPATHFVHAVGYAAWTVVQEFIAQSFFFLSLRRVLSPRQAIFTNGVLFAIAHWPNPVLVPVTLAGGWFLTACFDRYRNIYLLAIAHTLVALSIAVSVPDDVHRHMRVGRSYEQYHLHFVRPAPRGAIPPSR